MIKAATFNKYEKGAEDLIIRTGGLGGYPRWTLGFLILLRLAACWTQLTAFRYCSSPNDATTEAGRLQHEADYCSERTKLVDFLLSFTYPILAG